MGKINCKLLRLKRQISRGVLINFISFDIFKKSRNNLIINCNNQKLILIKGVIFFEIFV